MKKYSIKDIAELSGVSVATVSRVINDNGRFSEETRKRVLKIIEETGYKMNYNAKSLRMNKSFTIGILVPDISNYFFSHVVQKIEEILFEKGYTSIICNTARNEKKEKAYLQILQGKGVDGLIVISGVEEFSFDEYQSEKKIPYICIDREPKNKDHTIFISSNHYQGAFEATEELIKSGCNHPVIALYKRISTSSKERFKGFKDALKKNNFTFVFDENTIVFDNSIPFENKLKHFLKANPITDGIFSINDTIALELIIHLSHLNKKIPEQIKIIGFDDTSYARYSNPPLSSVHQNTEKIANSAVENLLGLIDKPSKIGKTIIIPVSLILRGSSKVK